MSFEGEAPYIAYQTYKRVIFIDTNRPDLEESEQYAEKVADFLGLEYGRMRRLRVYKIYNILIVAPMIP